MASEFLSRLQQGPVPCDGARISFCMPRELASVGKGAGAYAGRG